MKYCELKNRSGKKGLSEVILGVGMLMFGKVCVRLCKFPRHVGGALIFLFVTLPCRNKQREAVPLSYKSCVPAV